MTDRPQISCARRVKPKPPKPVQGSSNAPNRSGLSHGFAFSAKKNRQGGCDEERGWRSMKHSPSACERPGPRKNSVKFRRIFAGSLVMLLMYVSSLAAACDLSCGFSLFRSDCHSPEIASADSGPSDITMVAMTMPEMAGENSTERQISSSPKQAMPPHAALADLGACERQSCDQAQALPSKADHSTAAQFDTISTVAESSCMESLRIACPESRDGSPPFSAFVYSPLDVSLRI